MLDANQDYDRYTSSEQRDFRKFNVLHETETVGNNFLVILTNSWKTNLVKIGFEGCF